MTGDSSSCLVDLTIAKLALQLYDVLTLLKASYSSSDAPAACLMHHEEYNLFCSCML